MVDIKATLKKMGIPITRMGICGLVVLAAIAFVLFSWANFNAYFLYLVASGAAGYFNSLYPISEQFYFCVSMGLQYNLSIQVGAWMSGFPTAGQWNLLAWASIFAV